MSTDRESESLTAGPGRDAINTGDIRRMLLVLALPVLAEQMLNTFVGLFDTYLAGQIPGREVHATAAVGLAAYVGWLVSMLFMLVGTGTTALVARSVGEDRRDEADRLADDIVVIDHGRVIDTTMGLTPREPARRAAPRTSHSAPK